MTKNKKVAIIGRPNVGKSTLFNRLIQKRVSVTSEESGTTRDRILHSCEWLGKSFDIIDTGGYTNSNLDFFQPEINNQIRIALNEADLVIFLVSAKDGITKEDLIISKQLRNQKKKIILAINKVDNLEMSYYLDEFKKLGIEEEVFISSIHGIGISNLLDKIINSFDYVNEFYETNELRIGVIGKPNVGKSTLINTLLHDNRVIVSDVPGTTRDAIDTKVKYYNKEYIFIDTAGLKKNKDNLTDIEYYSELRTSFSIMNSNIILFVVDPIQKITKIDEQILSILKEEYKPTIILVNKIDLVTKEELSNFHEELKNEFKFFNDPYILNISALENKKMNKIFDAIELIQESLSQQISIPKLNNFLIDIQMIKKPPRHNGLNVKLNYITYSQNKYPHFIIFSNYPQYVHFSYQRFIENNIKRTFNFKGVPIRITFKKK